MGSSDMTFFVQTFSFLPSCVSRGIGERNLATHVISLNLSIKNHWCESVRDINDCLSVMCFGDSHFGTR
jgi:hypothetical protein